MKLSVVVVAGLFCMIMGIGVFDPSMFHEDLYTWKFSLVFFLIGFCCVFGAIGWVIYEFFYYRTRKFKEIKERIAAYIKDCNELNDHIESLKETSLLLNRTDYGKASYYDTSRWNYKRAQLKRQKYAPNIYSCSRTVCDNARKKPFEYVCKYF